MTLLPKSKFIWIFLVFVAYAYYRDYSETMKLKEAIPPTQSASEAAQSKNNKPAIQIKQYLDSESNHKKTIAEEVVDMISQTANGKVVLQALVKKSFEDKYGKRDLQVAVSEMSGQLSIIDTLRGTGASLNCGATAVINYSAFLSSGLIFDSTLTGPKTPLTVKVGAGQVIKGLDSGIVGMMEGGKRKISIPPQLAFDNPAFTNSMVRKGEVVTYDVELMSIKDGAYKTNEKITTITETPGTGISAVCGDSVKIKYSLAADENKESSFVLGSANAPLGLELAVYGMSVGGTKTINTPSVLLKTAGKKTKAAQSNAGGEVQVTLQLLEIQSK